MAYYTLAFIKQLVFLFLHKKIFKYCNEFESKETANKAGFDLLPAKSRSLTLCFWN